MITSLLSTWKCEILPTYCCSCDTKFNSVAWYKQLTSNFSSSVIARHLHSCTHNGDYTLHARQEFHMFCPINLHGKHCNLRLLATMSLFQSHGRSFPRKTDTFLLTQWVIRFIFRWNIATGDRPKSDCMSTWHNLLWTPWICLGLVTYRLSDAIVGTESLVAFSQQRDIIVTYDSTWADRWEWHHILMADS